MKGIPREVEASREHTITNSRQIRLLRKNFFLSDYQKDVLVGTLLGDGGLYLEGWAKNYRLQIEQGDKQRDYLFWKFDIFRNCCSSEPSYQSRRNKSWRKGISIHKDKRWWRLYIRKRSMNDFRNLISPYVIPSMRYKLPRF